MRVRTLDGSSQYCAYTLACLTVTLDNQTETSEGHCPAARAHWCRAHCSATPDSLVAARRVERPSGRSHDDVICRTATLCTPACAVARAAMSEPGAQLELLRKVRFHYSQTCKGVSFSQIVLGPSPSEHARAQGHTLCLSCARAGPDVRPLRQLPVQTLCVPDYATQLRAQTV